MSSELTAPAEPKAELDGPMVAFSIKLFKALHQYGTPTYRLEQLMAAVSLRLGLRGEFFSLPTGMFLSFGAPEEQRATIIRVQPANVDLGKLGALHDLTASLINGEIGAESADPQVDAIVTAKPPYSDFLTVLSYGVASGAGSTFFGGGWREIVVAAVIGIVLGLLSLMLGRSEDASRIFEPLAAVLAAALATIGARFLQPVSIYVATLAGLLVLFPGLTLTIAIRELATRHLVSGTAQLTGATLVFLELAFGVALGSEIDKLLPAVHLARHPLSLGGWAQWAALVVSPLTFGILLRARKKDLGWIVVAGAVGFAGTRLGASLLGPELGAFVGALLLGAGSNLYGRLLRRTSMVPLVPGLLMLVPGSVGFGSLSRFLESDVVSGIQTAFRMALIAISLVTGLLVANVVVPSRKFPG